MGQEAGQWRVGQRWGDPEEPRPPVTAARPRRILTAFPRPGDRPGRVRGREVNAAAG